jgi:hypothetical protein
MINNKETDVLLPMGAVVGMMVEVVGEVVGEVAVLGMEGWIVEYVVLYSWDMEGTNDERGQSLFIIIWGGPVMHVMGL